MGQVRGFTIRIPLTRPTNHPKNKNKNGMVVRGMGLSDSAPLPKSWGKLWGQGK